jgi:hypothetical protein
LEFCVEASGELVSLLLPELPFGFERRLRIGSFSLLRSNFALHGQQLLAHGVAFRLQFCG